MGQQDVFEVLKDGKWHSLHEIGETLGLRSNTIRSSIDRLSSVENIVFKPFRAYGEKRNKDGKRRKTVVRKFKLI